MRISFAAAFVTIVLASAAARGQTLEWRRLSSKAGDLPAPGLAKEQTGCLVLDIDKNGLNDIVVTSREAGSSMVWYQRGDHGWTLHPIDVGLNIEAGGAASDIDHDGDLDLVFGDDYSGAKLYWWENPAPRFTAATRWIRREIKSAGGTMHHDQIFGRFAGSATDQLAFWVQKSETLYLANPPRDPLKGGEWPLFPIARVGGAEGLARADIDCDGKLDLIGGGYWFKHDGGSTYQPMLIDPQALPSRAAAGQLVEGDGPETVFVIGDGVGRLKWFERRGDKWLGHDLLGEDVVHGHSLEIADINHDGHLDIFCAEMVQWTDGSKIPDNLGARMWIFYGDGRGAFARRLLATGIDNHESRVADLDGDGDLDIVVKPYTYETPRLDVWLNRGTGACVRAARPE